jgi:hypothetical protein
MRKLIALAVTGLLAASLLPGAAQAGKKPKQSVEGQIAMMAPWAGETLATCYSGGHRRLQVVTQEQANGIIGYSFDVDKKTLNKKFTLEPTGGQGDVDLDITFYTDFGTLEQATDTAYAPLNASYETREPGGEAGKVPSFAKKVIVCMHTGAGASFTYNAG